MLCSSKVGRKLEFPLTLSALLMTSQTNLERGHPRKGKKHGSLDVAKIRSAWEHLALATKRCRRHARRLPAHIARVLAQQCYANELMCVVQRCDDGESVSENPIESFSRISEKGKLRIEAGELPAWGLDACKNTLLVGPPFFCIDGWNVRFESSPPADYTGSGNREALVHALFFPTQGTERVHYMFVASYDARARSIRVRRIDPQSRIRLLLAAN
jgi:hypothetical protein